jgi:hypothetical protein
MICSLSKTPQAIPSKDAKAATYAAVASRGQTLTCGRLAGPAAPAKPPTPSCKQSRPRSLAVGAASLSTPLEVSYGIRPDYRILYKFGSAGYFRRTIESTGAKKSKFSDQSHTGIALGRSNYTNGMMFWDPATSHFSVSTRPNLLQILFRNSTTMVDLLRPSSPATIHLRNLSLLVLKSMR